MSKVRDDWPYRKWHRRLNELRGLARNYECLMCNRGAAHWAYDHLDPDEIQSPLGAFTTNAEHYWPLCRSCHAQVDASHRRRMEHRGWESDAAPLVERLAAGPSQGPGVRLSRQKSRPKGPWVSERFDEDYYLPKPEPEFDLI